MIGGLVPIGPVNTTIRFACNRSAQHITVKPFLVASAADDREFLQEIGDLFLFLTRPFVLLRRFGQIGSDSRQRIGPFPHSFRLGRQTDELQCGH
ncbi:MAG: hypothetical protein EA381_19575 [Planctomycetaceae bacterium]|nr:MAG: hypothetical protein EA381_19575 [Planctomycetaceae bacterium]